MGHPVCWRLAHLGDELPDEDELVARLGPLTRLGVARHRRRVQARRAVHVLHAVLEVMQFNWRLSPHWPLDLDKAGGHLLRNSKN